MENKYNGSYSMLCVYRLSNKMFEVQNTPRKIVSTVTQGIHVIEYVVLFFTLRDFLYSKISTYFRLTKLLFNEEIFIKVQCKCNYCLRDLEAMFFLTLRYLLKCKVVYCQEIIKIRVLYIVFKIGNHMTLGIMNIMTLHFESTLATII